MIVSEWSAMLISFIELLLECAVNGTPPSRIWSVQHCGGQAGESQSNVVAGGWSLVAGGRFSAVRSWGLVFATEEHGSSRMVFLDPRDPWRRVGTRWLVLGSCSKVGWCLPFVLSVSKDERWSVFSFRCPSSPSGTSNQPPATEPVIPFKVRSFFGGRWSVSGGRWEPRMDMEGHG